MADVFISHSSCDESSARALKAGLATLGHRAWIFQDEIEVGDSIPAAVGKALERAQYVVVCLSARALQSTWVQNELESSVMRQFAGNQRRVLPVRLEDVEPPPIIRHLHYVDFFSTSTTPSAAIEALGRAIGVDEQHPSAVARVPPVAPRAVVHAESRVRDRVSTWFSDAVAAYEAGVRAADAPLHGYFAIGHTFAPHPASISIGDVAASVQRSRSAMASALKEPLPISILNVHPARRTPQYCESGEFEYTFWLDHQVWWQRCQASTRGDCVAVRQYLEDRWDARPHRLSADVLTRQLLEYLVLLRELRKDFPLAEAAFLRARWTGLAGRVLSDTAIPRAPEGDDCGPAATQDEVEIAVRVDLDELAFDPAGALARLANRVLTLFDGASLTPTDAQAQVSRLLRTEPDEWCAVQVVKRIRSNAGEPTSASEVRSYMMELARHFAVHANAELYGASEERFIDALDATRPHVDAFEEVAAAALSTRDPNTIQMLPRSFEHFLAGYTSQRSDAAMVVDFFRFLGHELFTLVVAQLVRDGRLADVALVLDTPIFDPHTREFVRYDVLSEGVDALWSEAVPGRSVARKHATLLRVRHVDRPAERIDAAWLREADLLLYLASQLRSPRLSGGTWWPFTAAAGHLDTPRFLKAAREPEAARDLVDLLGGDRAVIVQRWPDLTRRVSQISVHSPWDGFDPNGISNSS